MGKAPERRQPESTEPDQGALEEYKLCVAKQHAIQGRIWPMASVLLIFSLGGLAVFGRESATDWETVAVVGVAGVASSTVIWLWRMLDWNETYWQDIVYERMWKLEQRLRFATNLSIHFVLLEDAELEADKYWAALAEADRDFVRDLRVRYRRRPQRMRHTFNWIAISGTLAWAGLFGVRLAEFVACR